MSDPSPLPPMPAGIVDDGVIRDKNFAFGNLPDGITNGQVFEDCNFAQQTARTVLFDGVTGLTFRSCNLHNCILPSDAAYSDCLYNPSGDPDNPLQQDIVDDVPVELSQDEQAQRQISRVIDSIYGDNPEAADAMKSAMTTSLDTAVSEIMTPIHDIGGIKVVP